MSASAYHLRLVFGDQVLERDINEKGIASEKKLATNLSKITKIGVVGDTGCRLTKSLFQSCSNEKEWPFRSIVKKVKEDKNEMILHLGDYHYREECVDKEKCQGLIAGYQWEPWDKDFFQPMSDLLDQTPMIAIRGNHEDCKRAHWGYRTFLSDGASATSCLEREEARWTTLAGGVLLINVDTSGISEIPMWSEAEEKKWIAYFNELEEKAKTIPHQKIWLATHKPLYGVVSFKGIPVPSNTFLRKCFEKSRLYKEVSLLIAGHLHLASFSSPTAAGPLQIVLGNSGTILDTQKGMPIDPKKFQYESFELVTKDFGFGQFVFNELKKEWAFHFKDSEGKILKSLYL